MVLPTDISVVNPSSSTVNGMDIGSTTVNYNDEVVVLSSSSKSPTSNRLAKATIKDVVVSSKAIHLLRKGINPNAPKTKLHKILLLQTREININMELRPFASKIGAAYSRKLSKGVHI